MTDTQIDWGATYCDAVHGRIPEMPNAEALCDDWRSLAHQLRTENARLRAVVASATHYWPTMMLILTEREGLLQPQKRQPASPESVS